MFVEKRRLGKTTKYYLVHSFRERNRVQKIRRYLGANLSPRALARAKAWAKDEILALLDELSTEVFLFSLSPKQIDILNRADRRIRVVHLDLNAWKRFTEEFVYHTNAIEGSSIPRQAVPKILSKKIVSDEEELETKGSGKAVEFIRRTKEGFSTQLIQTLHRLCFAGSKPTAGQFRTVDVVIKDARGRVVDSGVPVQDLQDALNDLVSWYKENRRKFKPLALSAIVHNQFEYIHPFEDGNGRVGRLLLNYVLIKHGYPPLNIALEDRQDYYDALRAYIQLHNLKPTIDFLVRQYRKTLRKVTTARK